jgi:hypothetical protein
MNTPRSERYLQHAAHLDELASKMEDARLSFIYAQLAVQWRQIAAQVERLQKNTAEIQELARTQGLRRPGNSN